MSKIDGLFAAIKISSTGLAAQRRRMNTIAENISNSATTRTDEGGPYRRKIMRFFENIKSTTFKSVLSSKQNRLNMDTSHKGHIRPGGGIETNSRDQRFSGVKVEMARDNAEPVKVYDPDHPDADDSGYVEMPNIKIVSEMVDMITATRAYEANISAIKTAKLMAQKALEI